MHFKLKRPQRKTPIHKKQHDYGPRTFYIEDTSSRDVHSTAVRRFTCHAWKPTKSMIYSMLREDVRRIAATDVSRMFLAVDENRVPKLG